MIIVIVVIVIVVIVIIVVVVMVMVSVLPHVAVTLFTGSSSGSSSRLPMGHGSFFRNKLDK